MSVRRGLGEMCATDQRGAGLCGSPYYDLPPERKIFGSSEAMQGVRQTLEKAAITTAPMLITGGTGTGKEVFPGHSNPQAVSLAGPLFKINCPILSCIVWRERSLW
jgi:DNA-binding NtrC family response regulator